MSFGVDLGTTNSAAALVTTDSGAMRILCAPNAHGRTTTPSVVSYLREDNQEEVSVLVGRDAQERANSDTRNTFRSIKRFLGRSMLDVIHGGMCSGDAEKVHELVPFQLNGSLDDKLGHINCTVACPALGRDLKCEEVSAEILAVLKRDVSKQAGCDVEQAVIAVPAYFDARQREATREACKLAGIDLLRIVDEPTAAAVAYGYGRRPGGEDETSAWWDEVRNTLGWASAPSELAAKEDDLLLCVFDLGGGTCDVSLLACGDGVFEVLSTAGDSQLGGDDFDQRIASVLLGEISATHGESTAAAIRGDATSMALLVKAAEEAKVSLSTEHETTVILETLNHTDGDCKVLLTREQMQAACAPLIARCIKVLLEAFEDAETTEGDPFTPRMLDGVILVGGATSMPIVRSAVAGFCTGGKPGTLGDPNDAIFAKARVDPDEAVALGAAIHAASLSNSGVNRRDVVVLDDQMGLEEIQLLEAKMDETMRRSGLQGLNFDNDVL